MRRSDAQVRSRDCSAPSLATDGETVHAKDKTPRFTSTAPRRGRIYAPYRFVRSIKDECLYRVIPFGERHLRRTIAEFVEHYHSERNHQGLANELIEGAPAVGRVGRIRRRPRLGGLLNYYSRAV